MTETAVVWTDKDDSRDAGASLGEQISTELKQQPPDALILFISPKYDVTQLLEAVQAACRPKVMMGCSSAGEFTSDSQGVGQASAVAIRSTEMRFACGIGRGLQADRAAVARKIVGAFDGTGKNAAGYSSALVLTDALAGHADDLIEDLTLLTGGNYQFFGGGAGDDANFRRTQVFCGTEVASDAAVALEILSTKPVGVGVRHGWSPASKPMRVTESVGGRLVSMNAIPAIELFEDHARATGQSFDPKDPMPFFLHNILGIDTGQGYKLRVPLAVHEDGSVSCAAEIPTGATVCIMSTDSVSASEAAASATREALQRLNGNEPKVALFFDCVATRLRLGRDFGSELKAVEQVLGPARFAGCNTYGQVARAEGQFSGFHNCTAVVCILPG
ncbi:MAG TPA: FIST N-terminal domain-containing protein [Tepidisphaeraceae bacterium]|nr:FIST N-terminal domain-containing protein [Tepidisphaeraceae bacterium]